MQRSNPRQYYQNTKQCSICLEPVHIKQKRLKNLAIVRHLKHANLAVGVHSNHCCHCQTHANIDMPTAKPTAFPTTIMKKIIISCAILLSAEVVNEYPFSVNNRIK